MNYPTHLILNKMDPTWALNQSKDIIKNLPLTQSGSASGKFSYQYHQYMFHKSSQHPLIKKFVNYCHSSISIASKVYEREFSIEWIYLAHCSNPREQMSIPHKDGRWMNGQFHLTILGESDIKVWKNSNPWEDENEVGEDLIIPNGTIWYLNGSEVWHTINAHPPEKEIGRLELLAPVNPMHMNGYKDCLTKCKNAIINPSSKKWKQIKKNHIKYQKDALKNKKASSPYSLNYIEEFD